MRLSLRAQCSGPQTPCGVQLQAETPPAALPIMGRVEGPWVGQASAMASVAASPVGLHCFDVADEVLGQADAKDLEKGDAHEDPCHNNQVVL